MRLIDTHTHIQMEHFENDRSEVIARAQAVGLERMLVVGCDPKSNRLALALTEAEEGLYPTIGWHPHDAKDWNQRQWEEVSRLAAEPRVVAVGEVGLDFFRNLSPQKDQEKLFRKAIQLARELAKPLIVHSRDSQEKVLQLLQEEGKGEVTGVMHCFSADRKIADRSLEIGFYISFAATLTYPKNDDLRIVATSVPADRLLVETDSPYLPPQNARGKRNEPAAVVKVVETLAQLRKIDSEELAQQIWQNAERLFRLAK